MLAGSAVLFASTTVVNGGNYLFNLVLGRWLGPAAFADLSLIVTLMLMVTLITVTLQTVAAKFAAAHTADGDWPRLASMRQWMSRWAWIAGLGLGLALCLGAPWIARFFHSASPWPFVLLGLGLPVYFAQGVDRGVLQGQTRFGRLALSYQAEMWVRLIFGLALVAVGWAVNGAVAALTLSFVAAWIAARAARASKTAPAPLARSERRAILVYAAPVGAALVGQILINNSDILIVKRFFPAHEAGQYAALALIGRIVFFATWSVVTTMFPIVAQRHQQGRPHRRLLAASLGLVALVSGGIIALAYQAPEAIVGALFGQAYLSISPLLWQYAVATALYALANVVINYRLSAGRGGSTSLAVVAGVAQVAGLWLFHASLRQVVWIQIYLMGALLLSLLVWELWPRPAARRAGQTGPEETP